FFVLSGYLITSIILRNDVHPRFVVAFWLRRALRIWPAYYLLLAIVCAWAVYRKEPPRLDSALEHLTFTQNLPRYWSGTVPPFVAEARQTWSLAIEEQFYLIWPLLILFTGRSAIIPAALWLIVVSASARIYGMYPAIALARCDGLALGAILAVILGGDERSRQGTRWRSVALAAAGMSSLAFISGPALDLEASIPGVSGCG